MKFNLLFLALFSSVASAADLTTFVYPCTVVSVYDGDTVTLDITWAPELVADNTKGRLFGIDTPEIRTKDADEKVRGYAARDLLRSMLQDHEVKVQLVQSRKRYRGKFGRWIIRLWVKGQGVWCEKDQWCDANSHLVKTGHAVEAFY